MRKDARPGHTPDVVLSHEPSSTPPSELQELSVLFREHAPFVWRVLRRLGVSEYDADDVTQEVFLVVHRKLDGFRGDSRFTTWLYGICVRVASDHRRKLRRRREDLTDEPPSGSAPPRLDELLDLDRARAVLDRILDELDEDKRAVFVLFEIEQLPMQQVSEIVGCGLKTAYSRLRAARSLVERRARALQEQPRR